MNTDTLFGPETNPAKPRSIMFKQVRAVDETLAIKEGISDYIA